MSDKFAFDGGDTTAKALRREIPVYSEGALQTALESGCQSVPAVMQFLARRDAEKQAQKSIHSRKGAMVTKGTFKYSRRMA